MLIAKKRSGRPSNRPDAEKLAELYSGHTAQQIADMYNVSVATVRTWINNERRKERIENGNV